MKVENERASPRARRNAYRWEMERVLSSERWKGDNLACRSLKLRTKQISDDYLVPPKENGVKGVKGFRCERAVRKGTYVYWLLTPKSRHWYVNPRAFLKLRSQQWSFDQNGGFQLTRRREDICREGARDIFMIGSSAIETQPLSLIGEQVEKVSP